MSVMAILMKDRSMVKSACTILGRLGHSYTKRGRYQEGEDDIEHQIGGGVVTSKEVLETGNTACRKKRDYWTPRQVAEGRVIRGRGLVEGSIKGGG